MFHSLGKLSPLKLKNENLSPSVLIPIEKEQQSIKNENLFTMFEDDEWDLNDVEV